MPEGVARAFPRSARFTVVFAFGMACASFAYADGPEATRSAFADRRWDAVTATDAGLAGSGLATDPQSSLYGNPALGLDGPAMFRVSGLLSLPHRDDLQASTTDFEDGTGFPAVGELGARWRMKGLGLTAYYSQPHYEHEETRFVGIDPGTGDLNGDVYPRRNEFTSATRYAGLGAAVRLKNGLALGLAGEAVMLKERYLSTPVPVDFPGAVAFDVDRSATSFGGAIGAAYTVNGLVTIGASYRAAGSVSYDDGGSDEAPKLTLIGVKVGRTAGSSGYAGARFLGARDANLAEPLGTPHSADARSEYAAGYAYLDPAGAWSFRLGGGASPRPSDGALKLSRFGVALGAGAEGAKVGLAYEHTSENRPSGRASSRDLIALTVEVSK